MSAKSGWSATSSIRCESGRHVDDIVKDSYIVDHFDEVARDRILEHPAVIKSIEAEMRRQFAGYGDSVDRQRAEDVRPDSAGRSERWRLPDL